MAVTGTNARWQLYSIAAMGNADLRMARLLASTLVLAGTAWASAGALPAEGQALRQAATRLEAARNQHGVKALALLFAADADLLGATATQVHWDSSGEAISREVADPARSGWAPLADARQNGPWLVASASSVNLLANPPPR